MKEIRRHHKSRILRCLQALCSCVCEARLRNCVQGPYKKTVRSHTGKIILTEPGPLRETLQWRNRRESKWVAHSTADLEETNCPRV